MLYLAVSNSSPVNEVEVAKLYEIFKRVGGPSGCVDKEGFEQILLQLEEYGLPKLAGKERVSNECNLGRFAHGKSSV